MRRGLSKVRRPESEVGRTSGVGARTSGNGILLAPLLVACLLLAANDLADAAPVRLLTVTVATVVDGDTLTAFTSHARLRIRLLGIDAPELAHEGQPGQPYGPEATRHLEGLIAGKSVRVEAYGRDRYHRVLAVLWVDRRNVNVEMVRAGWALVRGGSGRRAYADELKRAEAQARREGLGIWASGPQRGPQRPAR